MAGGRLKVARKPADACGSDVSYQFEENTLKFEEMNGSVHISAGDVPIPSTCPPACQK
jgi:hypothetical protein